MEKTYIGQVSPDQIEAWKKEVTEKYGEGHKVFAYKVDGRVAYLRSVDRDCFAMASSKIGSAGPAAFTRAIIESTWLGGDDTIRRNDQYYFGLQEMVDTLVAKKKGDLGEL